MAEKRQGLSGVNSKKGSSASPAKKPNVVPRSQDGKKQTQEQDPGQSRFRRALEMFLKFKGRREKTTEDSDKFSSRPTDASIASIECAEMSNYIVKADQVPAMVRIMHERLASPETADVRLFMNILRMAEEHPAGVVLTLLRCAPTCDRAAAMMWRAIGTSGSTVGKVLPILLCVMEDWPLHSMCTSDGDNEDVFALAATLVIWVMVQVPKSHEAMYIYAPHLLVALLAQIFDSTVHGTEEVDNFWTQCQAEHNLQTNPSRFAVQTMKSLLCRLRCDNVVMAMERKRGWDTLLSADTQHYATGLLAREMHRDLTLLCSRIACHLLGMLSTPRWDLPALAFLVEVLDCLDLCECRDGVLEMMSRYLQSECKERRRLALRGLVVLIKDTFMARRIGMLSQRLVDVLGDADGEMVRMSLSVFMNVLHYKGIMVSCTTAPRLAEALLPLFDHDNSHVRVLSIQLFHKVMDLVVDEGKKAMKRIVSESLLPLFLHCHEENQRLAEASIETLLHAAGFLKKRGLKQVVKKEKLWKFAKRLVRTAWKRQAEAGAAP
ncbi:PREDICTED: uncharacterized protein LOC101807205 [Ficedula albicollis]|uniref:uncharacterized protein LOC101807205 n=1 Tax=Ficedula albicollis TaxID=59894 RepID=UPI00035988AE|nr:PREDICTED: uncharacterized protein LOC101807205 [Ficedula albicollis]